MIEDDVLQEVRAAREAYARAHGYDVRAMVADLHAQDSFGDWPVVRHSPRRPGQAGERAAEPDLVPRPTGSA